MDRSYTPAHSLQGAHAQTPKAAEKLGEHAAHTGEQVPSLTSEKPSYVQGQGPAGNPESNTTQIFTAISPESAPDVTIAAATKDPTLHVIKGPSAGMVFTLVDVITTIGRSPECSIFLNHMTVSREHTRITKTIDGLYLEDMGSLNGTWVNGAIVSEAKLTEGSIVQVGTFVMSLHLHGGE